MSNNRGRLYDLIDQKVLHITESPFTLSTGLISNFYFDCKAVTLDGEGLSLIATAFLDAIEHHFGKVDAVGGLTMGADFITAAIAMKGYDLGKNIRYGSIVRKEAKLHGTRNNIENTLPANTKIVVIDDVITSGESTKKACISFIDAGYKIAGIIALIDREQGGKDNLKAHSQLKNIAVHSLFTSSDFPRIAESTKNSGSVVATA